MAAFGFAISTAPLARAQEPLLPIRSVTTSTVKTERAGDLAAAIKEYNEVLKKAHSKRGYTIWRSVSGPIQFLRVQTYAKWSELDEATDPALKDYRTEMARISTRINESFSSSTRVLDKVYPDVSLGRPAETPKLIVVWHGLAKEDKLQEAIALFKSDYLPAVKAAGGKLFLFATPRFGAPVREIRISANLDSWSKFDEPNAVTKAMGPEKAKAFSSKMISLLESDQYNIYRLDEELSYTPVK